MSETRKLAAILVTDVVGYSRLDGAEEERTLAHLTALRRSLVAPTFALHHGRVVDRTGDISIHRVPQRRRCGALRDQGADWHGGLPEDGRIKFRVDIHVGDVVEERGALLGDGVNIAARLEVVAKPAAIKLSRLVRASPPCVSAREW
jgi:adenylate cyclase